MLRCAVQSATGDIWLMAHVNRLPKPCDLAAQCKHFEIGGEKKHKSIVY